MTEVIMIINLIKNRKVFAKRIIWVYNNYVQVKEGEKTYE